MTAHDDYKVLGKNLAKDSGSDVTQSLEWCIHADNSHLACVKRFFLGSLNLELERWLMNKSTFCANMRTGAHVKR